MLRSVLKRILVLQNQSKTLINQKVVLPPITTISSRFTTNSNPPFSHQINPTSPQNLQPEDISHVAETLASATATAAEAAATATEEGNKQYEKQRSREGERRPRVEYQDEQARVLQSALPHVVSHYLNL